MAISDITLEEPTEGQIRTNPETGKQEMFDPSGVWREISPENAAYQINPLENTDFEPAKEPIVITRDEGEKKINEINDAINETVQVYGPDGRIITISRSDL